MICELLNYIDDAAIIYIKQFVKEHPEQIFQGCPEHNNLLNMILYSGCNEKHMMELYKIFIPFSKLLNSKTILISNIIMTAHISDDTKLILLHLLLLCGYSHDTLIEYIYINSIQLLYIILASEYHGIILYKSRYKKIISEHVKYINEHSLPEQQIPEDLYSTVINVIDDKSWKSKFINFIKFNNTHLKYLSDHN